MADSLGLDVEVELVDVEATLQRLETKSSEKMNSSNANFSMETVFTNRLPSQLFTGEQKLWSGTTGTTAVTIPQGSYMVGTHRNSNPPAKYGRVYYDAQNELPTTRKFIIAFDSPTGKVYAESGPFGPVDWNVVEDRLGKSERTVEYVDHILGGKIEAGVHENGNAYARFMMNA